jgi:hypothetical protein
VHGPTYTDLAGSEVDFDLNATQAGTTNLVLAASYTIDLLSPVYCYASRYQYVLSEPFPIPVAPAAILIGAASGSTGPPDAPNQPADENAVI